MLSAILCSIHNVHFYQQLMQSLRTAIREDRFEDFALAWREEYTRDGTTGESREKRD